MLGWLLSLAVWSGLPQVEEPRPAAPAVSDAMLETFAWRSIGPYRGGRCTAVCGVPGEPMVGYFGATGGGVWKTTDGGNTWRCVSDGQFATGSVGAIATAPAISTRIFVGMGEAPFRGVASSSGDGVYRSDDGGVSWRHMGLDDVRQISRIVVDPFDPDRILVAAQGDPWRDSEHRGVYRSVDGGATWERVLFVDGRTGVSDLAMDARDPRRLYAGMWSHRRRPWFVESGGEGGGVYRSFDGGDTWTRLTEGLPELAGKVGVTSSPANPRRVFALIEADEGGLFRSDDGGDHFTRVNDDRLLRARAWYYTHVVADPVDPDTVYVMNAELLKSIDGGKTFRRIPTPHGDNHALWVDPSDPRRLINGNDGGACVSFNGGATWSTQDNQPTGQFYRVITDHGVPYRVYGGQQDNTTVSIASRTASAGIGRADWYAVGGCESAFVAFDPDDPRFIYAGCYQGLISEYDATTGATRGVQAWPDLGLGADSAKQRYRFNWNAPIVVSRHDPSTIFHAGNAVLQSDDRGVSWREVSPDLTRDDDTKQGAGGGPITNEAAGGEVYGTIAYLAESPHRSGVLWVGSDDGLLHRTRDGGETWERVTPAGLGESLINCIELSPHEVDAAYVVTTRYKFGERTPYVWRTRDGGATWMRVTKGIPDDEFARAVREDPIRRGLLYAATDRGVYVSFDDGEMWQTLRRNLPAVPVTDIAVRDDDLVISTEGRGFWILDDIGPLRDLPVADGADVQLFTPAAYVSLAGGGQPVESNHGANPPDGVMLRYVLSDAVAATDAAVRVEIVDASGSVLRTLQEKEKKGEPSERPAGVERPSDDRVPTRRAGMNRVRWDARVEEVTEIPGQPHFGSRQGYRVSPGRYLARVVVGDHRHEVAVEVRDDPRRARAAGDFVERDALLREIHRAVDDLHRSINQSRRMRNDIEQVVTRVEGRGGADEIRTRADELRQRLEEWEGLVVQARQKTFQDVINFENRLNARMLAIIGGIDESSPPINAGQRALHASLMDEYRDIRAAFDRLVGEDVARFNALVAGWQIPAVTPPTHER